MEKDPLENRKRHDEAVRRTENKFNKRGYKTRREVTVKVNTADGNTELRRYDLMATPKGGGDPVFIEVKTYQDTGKKPGARSRGGRLRNLLKIHKAPQGAKNLADALVRGGLGVVQAGKDENLINFGGTIASTGQKIEPGSIVSWHIFRHDKKGMRALQPITIDPFAEMDDVDWSNF